MPLRGFTSTVLRWPILFVVFLILLLEFFGYLCVRACVGVIEFSSGVRHRAAKGRLRTAKDFVSWCQAARELDRLERRTEWRKHPASPYYDHVLVAQHRDDLLRYRSAEDWDSLLELLKRVLQTYNVGGLNNAQLYSQTHFGTKELVDDFLTTVLECLIIVRDAEAIPLQTRREFFRRARKWYGRTALLLSGGAAMGYYHIGVIKSLLEAKCLPQILSGASAGSLMCSYLSVRTDQEILENLCVPESERIFRACCEPVWTKLRRWLKHGYCFDRDNWIVQMRTNITKGDTTFLEAYKMTGRIINISVTGTSKYSPTMLLNYRSAPDVVIWSAVLASSAFPNFLQPQQLMLKNPRTGELSPYVAYGKTWFDGTIKNDIPQEEMAKLWGVNFFVCSQVNPHLVPLFFAQSGGTGRPAPRYLLRLLPGDPGSGLRGGFVLSMLERLLKLDMGKWFRLLADLDLLPTVFGADWRFIYLQKLKGTVTIVPDAPWWVYPCIVSDPTLKRMGHYILTGERATWPKLARISNHFRVEKTLIECSRMLEREAQRAGLAPLKGAKETVNHRNEGDVLTMAPETVAGGAPRPSPSPGVSPVGASSEVAASAASWESTHGSGSSEASGSGSSGNGHHGGASHAASSRNTRTRGASGSKKTFQGLGHGAAGHAHAGDALHPPLPPHPSASLAASPSPSPSLSPVAFDAALEEVDDPLVTRAELASGEIKHSLTAALLGADPAPPRPRPQHESSASPAAAAAAAFSLDDTLYSPSISCRQPLWKRGVDTDMDNTDEDEFDGVERYRGANGNGDADGESARQPDFSSPMDDQ